MDSAPILGVIGGSGLYEMDGLEDVEIREMQTPFGEPSSPIITGILQGKRIAFIARHGVGHIYAPAEVNYRANISAFKMLGIDQLVAVSACGSLREDYAPGDIVIPDQLFDRTEGRKRTFFGDGLVAHISVAEPFCRDFSSRLVQSVAAVGGTVHDEGTFITIQGPRFSTRAESNTYRAWGMSIIGMTTSPEAFLAREAGMCYAVMAHVTDYDVWHISEEPVTVEMVIRILKQNTQVAQKALTSLVSQMTDDQECECQNALRDAIITNQDLIPPDTRRKLSFLDDRYLS
jgi:5'-methylthioadenosine phosphorylase